MFVYPGYYPVFNFEGFTGIYVSIFSYYNIRGETLFLKYVWHLGETRHKINAITKKWMWMHFLIEDLKKGTQISQKLTKQWEK